MTKFSHYFFLQKNGKKVLTYVLFLIEYVSQVKEVIYAGIAQLARASAFQAEGCEFESHCPLHLQNLQIKVDCIIYLLLSIFILYFGCIAQLVRAHDW